MITINDFITGFNQALPAQANLLPWQVTAQMPAIILEILPGLSDEYIIDEGIAIHKTAVVENGAVLKAPAIIGAGCFIGASAYVRGGVWLANNVKLGTGVEIKSSLVFSNSSIAHFNFIGDSIIGNHVNFEAGAITANHFNERVYKNITVVYKDNIIDTGISKFGSLIGDHCKVGANAVLSPGTILPPGSIVKRLELIDQLKP